MFGSRNDDPHPPHSHDDGLMKPLDHNARTVSTTDIIVGKRPRHDLGDIDELARSIAEVSLLHPIVIRPDGTLIAGVWRLACSQFFERL